jgi:hypothetical protein
MAADTLYALVDAARDDRLYPLVMQSSEQQCLFAGKIEPPLDSVAPYLVNLKAHESLFHAWRDIGRGKSWGVLCRSDLPFKDLRRHFRHFLQARLPDGTVILFRFFDPRVFGTYLPRCGSDELAQWFAGVSAYLVEEGAGGGFHEFNLRGGRLYDGDKPAA